MRIKIIKNHNNIEELILSEFKRYFDLDVVNIINITKGGSERIYFRIFTNDSSIIAVYNSNIPENLAFLEFAEHFASLNINVPKVLAKNSDNNIYFLNDLGDSDLLSIVLNDKKDDNFISPSTLDLYKTSIAGLAKIQIIGHKNLDYSLCYQGNIFDGQSMLNDIEYFKKYFLSLYDFKIDTFKFTNEISKLISFLDSADKEAFLYRDFQARNIMINNDIPYFIDFQSGRKGAVYYDIASLLYQAKAKLHINEKEELVDTYLNEVNQYKYISGNLFKQFFPGFVLIRIMQTLGAYGFRGIVERKSHFLDSLPLGITNIKSINDHWQLPFDLPYLRSIFDKI